MADAPAIAVQNLTKDFVIHRHQGTTLKETVIRNLFRPGERVPYRALDGVSFELARGRSLAIVGGNGSGKSTLLKIIAGLSKPDSGSIQVNGKVVALLELGAAFQQEFTGMENIFLQCSVMGLTRAQILERLDDILDFCELDRFIHTPVKRYSSGMVMRLAFSVALFVDAEILLLDEVLAVGDQAFQTKCKQKIRQLRREGKTILFVSHIAEQIAAIADDILWLEKGKELAYGTAEEILPRFFAAMQVKEEAEKQAVHIDHRAQAALPSARFAAKRARIEAVRFLGEDGTERRHFSTEDVIRLEVEAEVLEPLEGLELTVAFGTVDSVRAAWFESDDRLRDVKPGRYIFRATVEKHHLRPALYLVSMMLGDPEDFEKIHDLHLRLHAISLYQEGAESALERYERKLLPWGKFIS
jgi:ABC-type polysaccharide/polyol phosphate transport system ATPase subunit